VNKGTVFSIKLDPYDPRRFGALSEEGIQIYDIRNFKQPMAVINSGGGGQ
jgi:hypothetical protein